MSAPVPSGWTETTLGRVLQRSPSYGINAPALPRGVGRYPYLRITDIDEAGRVDIGSLPSVRDTASDAYILSEGDIVVARTGASVGKSHLFRDVGEPVVFAGFLIRLSADKNTILPSYLTQIMQTAHYWDWIRENSARSGQPGVNGQQLKTIPIVLPPLPEQEAIAAALSDADGVVAGLERVIAKKRLIKQGAMQDLLTARRRLPGFSGEWEVKRLGAALTVRHGRSQKDVEDPTGEYPILATGGQIGTATKFLCDKPSVLIGRKGTIDAPRFMDKPFWSVDTLFYTDVHSGFDAKFLFYAFMLIDWMSFNEASGVPSLNAKTIENIEISIPKIDEQQAIAAVLSDMDAEIQTLESRLAKARAVKEGMMQNLLTARVRLV